MRQTSRRISLNSIIKVAFAIMFFAAIGYRLFVKDDLTVIGSEFLYHWNPARIWILAVVMILMPVNWILETRKWTILLSPSIRLTMLQGLYAILSGLAFSLFTPNRIGEYGGRILYVPAEYNWRAVIATLIGSMGQITVHVACGLVAVLFITFAGPDDPLGLAMPYWALAGFVLAVMGFCYFRSPLIAAWLLRFSPVRWLRRPWRGLRHLQKITTNELAIAFGISFLRYTVFTIQFVLLLEYFGIGVPREWIVAGVGVMFLVQTSIPLPPFVDVFARSEIAVILWASFQVNELSVLAASLSIWILNVLIPAFFGLYAISRVNVLQSLGYAQKKSSQNHVVNIDDPVDGLSSRR